MGDLDIVSNDQCLYVVQTVSIMKLVFNSEKDSEFLKKSGVDVETQSFRDCIYLASINKNRLSYAILTAPFVELLGISGFYAVPIIFTLLLWYRIMRLVKFDNSLSLLIAAMFLVSPVFRYSSIVGPEMIIFWGFLEIVIIVFKLLKGENHVLIKFRFTLVIALLCATKTVFVYLTPVVLYLAWLRRKDQELSFWVGNLAVNVLGLLLFFSPSLGMKPQK